MPGTFITQVSHGAAPERWKGFYAGAREMAEPTLETFIGIADLDRFLTGAGGGTMTQSQRVAVRLHMVAGSIQRDIRVAGLAAPAHLGFCRGAVQNEKF